MKRILIFKNVVMVFCFVLLSIGCIGVVLTHFQGMSIAPKENLNVADPLQVNSDAIRKISKIAVPYLVGRDRFKDEHGWRLYNAEMEVLIDELKKNQRFQVIPVSISKLKDMGLFTDSSKMLEMSEEDYKDHLMKIGKAVNAEAVLEFGEKMEEVNMGAAFLTVAFVGTANFDGAYFLKLFSVPKGETIYHQEKGMTITSGQLALKNTRDPEVREMVRPVIKPLVQNLIDTFPSKKE